MVKMKPVHHIHSIPYRLIDSPCTRKELDFFLSAFVTALIVSPCAFPLKWKRHALCRLPKGPASMPNQNAFTRARAERLDLKDGSSAFWRNLGMRSKPLTVEMAGPSHLKISGFSWKLMELSWYSLSAILDIVFDPCAISRFLNAIEVSHDFTIAGTANRQKTRKRKGFGYLTCKAL